MENYSLKDWIPYQLNFEEKAVTCQWLYLSDATFNEPFFQETTSKCMAFEENNKVFKSVTNLESIVSFSENVPYIEPTAFIFHISRSGSTLLTQLLSLDSSKIVISEAPILDEVIRKLAFCESAIGDEEIDRLVHSVVKLLGKKRSGNEQELFFKLDSWHIFFYEKLRKLYPETPFIFIFRRPDEVIRSQIKQPGMHAMPGVIQPELFGFELNEMVRMKQEEYIAKVLEKYFEDYLAIINSDKKTLFLDYSDGILPMLNKVEDFLHFKIDGTLKASMITRMKFHSKNPNTIFDEKEIDGLIPEYQKDVFALYEKLKLITQSI